MGAGSVRAQALGERPVRCREISGRRYSQEEIEDIAQELYRDDVAAAFARAVGEECWSIIAGPGTGSVVLVDLGPKSRGEHELRNDVLTDK